MNQTSFQRRELGLEMEVNLSGALGKYVTFNEVQIAHHHSHEPYFALYSNQLQKHHFKVLTSFDNDTYSPGT